MSWMQLSINLLGHTGIMISFWIWIRLLFLMHGKKRLNLKGARTIDIRKSTADTKRAACTVMAIVSVRLLLPFLIFNGLHSVTLVPENFWISPKKKKSVHEWVDNDWLGWKGALMVYCWCIGLYHAHNSSLHVSMSHDELCCKCNGDFGGGSWTHPWWMYCTHPTSGCLHE